MSDEREPLLSVELQCGRSRRLSYEEFADGYSSIQSCPNLSAQNCSVNAGAYQCDIGYTHNEDIREDPSCPINPKTSDKKQSSIVTIFSVWNTMMGSSLLCIPWALGEAGFVLGIALLVFMAFICCYTAYRIVRSVDGVVKTSDAVWEFSDVCHYYFGRLGLYVSIIFSVSALLGAAMAYWVLMSNFLYHTVKFAYEKENHLSVSPVVNVTDGVECPSLSNQNSGNIPISYINQSLYRVSAHTDPAESNSTGYHSIFLEVWQQNFTVPLSLAVLLFPLINFKSPTFFTKFNSLGTISVMYILVFVTVKAIGWGLHIDFDSASPVTSVPLTNLTFPALTGLLSLSYFLHNGILSIMHNQKHPENNGRDLCISYGLVALTYMWIGVAFYSTFPLQKDCIESNLLDNFPSADIMAIIARLLLLFQLVTIYPLLLYIMRVQLMNAMFGKSWPGLKYIIVLNLAIVCLCVLCAIFFPQIGTIIRFSGAFSGLAYIFTLPCLVYMVYSWRSGTLTWKIVFIHTFIIAFGVANFIGQFVILKL